MLSKDSKNRWFLSYLFKENGADWDSQVGFMPYSSKNEMMCVFLVLSCFFFSGHTYPFKTFEKFTCTSPFPFPVGV